MRRPRILEPDARYHVTARTNRQEGLLEPEAMKALFLRVVSRAKTKYRFRLENFCVMGNHFHFIIQPAHDSSLSAILQWILSVFAMAWNRLQGLTGHVWGQRFFSNIISGAHEYLRTFLYIDNNPVVTGLVESPEDWVFGGRGFRNRNHRDLLDDPPKDLWSGIR